MNYTVYTGGYYIHSGNRRRETDLTGEDVFILRKPRLGLGQEAFLDKLPGPRWTVQTLIDIEKGRITLSEADAAKIRETFPDHFGADGSLLRTASVAEAVR